jgi:hypothetical protein
MREILQQALEKYLSKEMPAGTVIGDPVWWSSHIAKVIDLELAKPDLSKKQQNVNTSEERVQVSSKNVHEPVAYVEKGDLYWCDDVSVYDADKLDGLTLYTAPPCKRWVGLTDDEIYSIWKEIKDAVCLDHQTFASAIEAKLRSKNVA